MFDVLSMVAVAIGLGISLIKKEKRFDKTVNKEKGTESA